jgi:alkyl hydroperoxide reductase subunit F
MFDLIIIGGGPAGCAAAVYAARKRLKTLMLAYEFGGQSTVSEDIQNWIGTPHISGADLAKTLKAHVLEYKADILEVKEGQNVSKIEKSGDMFAVTTDGKETFTAKSVLVTSGSGRRKLEVPGAAQFENKGLTYCASCDGPLFADQDVIVVGGGNAGFESAAQLLAYCKSVTLLNRSDAFRADEVTIEKLSKNPKLKLLKNIEMKAVTGEKFVTGMDIVYKDTGASEHLAATGIFVEIGQIPNTDFVKGFLDVDAFGKIVVDPMTQQTSVPGVWAAGDVTNGLYHQNNIAAGDAVKALEDLYLHLHTK